MSVELYLDSGQEEGYRRGGVLLRFGIVVNLTNVLLCDDMQQDRCDKRKEADDTAHEVHHRGTAEFTSLFHDNRLGCHSGEAGRDGKHLDGLHARRQGAIVDLDWLSILC